MASLTYAETEVWAPPVVLENSDPLLCQSLAETKNMAKARSGISCFAGGA